MLKKINERIEEKVTQGEGTWIDWQYLKDAATHLTKVNKLLLHYFYIICVITVSIHFKVHLPICLLHGGNQKTFSELYRTVWCKVLMGKYQWSILTIRKCTIRSNICSVTWLFQKYSDKKIYNALILTYLVIVFIFKVILVIQ